MTETMNPPAPAQSNPLKWILIGGCGCLAVACIGFTLFFLGVFGVAMAATQPAADAAQRHLDLVRTGQVDAAYEETSQAFQASTTREEFQAFVEQNPALYQATELSFPSRNVQNQVARLTGTASGGPGGQVAVQFELVHEGASWRVQNVGSPR